MEETQKTDEPQGEQKKPEAAQSKINAMALISYIGVLSLIPYFTKDTDEFAKFHAKQGFVLFLLEVASYVVMVVIPLFGFIVGEILGLVWVVLSVLGILNVTKNKKEKLPIIGDLTNRF